MSTSDIVIHYIGRGCHSPNPRKYTALNGNFGFDLRDVFQEGIHGVNRDLLVFIYLHLPCFYVCIHIYIHTKKYIYIHIFIGSAIAHPV